MLYWLNMYFKNWKTWKSSVKPAFFFFFNLSGLGSIWKTWILGNPTCLQRRNQSINCLAPSLTWDCLPARNVVVEIPNMQGLSTLKNSFWIPTTGFLKNTIWILSYGWRFRLYCAGRAPRFSLWSRFGRNAVFRAIPTKLFVIRSKLRRLLRS